MPLLLLLPPSTPPPSSGGWGTGGWGTGFWGGGGTGSFDDPSLQNLSFEDPGLQNGDAEFWTTFAYDPAGSYAAWEAIFGWEDYETWVADNSPLTDAVTEVARFFIQEDGASTVTTAFESMGSGWPGTDTLVIEVGNSEDAVFGDDSVPYEDFDSFWLSAPHLEEVPAGIDTVENFEFGWGNGVYITDLLAPPAGSLTTAQFDFTDYEDFEETMRAVLATADASTDRLSVESHEFPSGQRVTLEFEGVPPGGLQALRPYYVNVLSATLLQLLNADSSTVAITADGTGTTKIIPDGAAYWYDFLD